MAVRDKLVALLSERGIIDPKGLPSEVDRIPLFSSDALSSLDLMSLVLDVEEEVGRSVPNSELTPSNFDSIVAIESLMARLRASAEAARREDAAGDGR